MHFHGCGPKAESIGHEELMVRPVHENPYEPPQTCCSKLAETEGGTPYQDDVGYWIVLALSPLLIIGGLILGAWLFL